MLNKIVPCCAYRSPYTVANVEISAGLEQALNCALLKERIFVHTVGEVVECCNTELLAEIYLYYELDRTNG